MRYTKYKKLYKVSLFGTNDKVSLFGTNDAWFNKADTQYRTPGSSFTNGKTCRFRFNGAFNDAKLSKNARLILESAYLANDVDIRIVTSSKDAVFDTVKQTSGNPILVSFHQSNLVINNN
jgi:hypothetical protein